MRKTLIAVLAALTSLAVVAVALAQNPAPTASLDVSLKPTKVGTKKKPRSGRIELSAETNREAKTTASRIEIMVPKGIKLSTRGLKKCTTAELNSDGKAGCPKASKAGSGEADALLNPYATNPSPIKFIVTVFAGGRENGKDIINFFLESDSPEVSQALPGKVTKVRSKLYGQKLTIDIARNLQAPVDNPNDPSQSVYSSLQRLEASIGLKGSKKRMLVGMTDCPKARENQFELRLTFVPNPNPPTDKTASAIDGARCSG